GIEIVVSKNAGGTGAYAKIGAARALRLPVIMIDRPKPPARREIHDADAVFDWLAHYGTDPAVKTKGATSRSMMRVADDPIRTTVRISAMFGDASARRTTRRCSSGVETALAKTITRDGSQMPLTNCSARLIPFGRDFERGL